jgi:hypothetical protein
MTHEINEPLKPDEIPVDAQPTFDLKLPTEPLTPEVAERIAEHFDIRLVVGTHGIAGGDVSDPRTRPTAQKDYDAAADVVESMEPGDILFVENYGTEIDPLVEAQSIMAALAIEVLGSDEVRQQIRNQIEPDRQSASSFTYAYRLARSRDITVVFADFNPGQKAAAKELSGDRELLELIRSPLPEDRELADAIDAERELQARDIVVDWARESLPPEGTPPPERKRQLVLLFGLAHKEGLERAFSEVGLKPEVTILGHEARQEQAVGHSLSGGVMDSLIKGKGFPKMKARRSRMPEGQTRMGSSGFGLRQKAAEPPASQDSETPQP